MTVSLSAALTTWQLEPLVAAPTAVLAACYPVRHAARPADLAAYNAYLASLNAPEA
jgi:hypothetical protein